MIENSSIAAKQGVKLRPVAAIDLFCGVGGLTHGLVMAGIPVVAGIDLDPACRFPFSVNNSSSFILSDIAKVTCDELLAIYPKNASRVLVGCAPCQAFSRYARKQDRKNEQKWRALNDFARLVKGVRPMIVSMENVPELQQDSIFDTFVQSLCSFGYHVTFSCVYCPDYGVPQQRTRLVLLASLKAPFQLIQPTHSPAEYCTVRDAIGDLQPLSVGDMDTKDKLHRASNLSDLNRKRMKASKPGGTWRDWPSSLRAKCHQAKSGKTYPSVYGRMEWDKPSPTITTQYFGYGNGRFGHPVQDRAISLREGSILQSFPKSYRFCENTEEVSFSVIGRLIGNAVPVRLGEVIGKSILSHLAEFHE